PLRKLIANALWCLGRRLRVRFTFHRPEDQVAKAPPVNEQTAIGAPGIFVSASRDKGGAKHKRVDETAGDYGDFGEEQRVIVFLNAEIRPEHLVVLPADHADDRPLLLIVGARTRIAALVVSRADIAIELSVCGLAREFCRSHLSESRELLNALR